MSTNDAHPTLRKAAEAMSDADPEVDEENRGLYPWEHYLPMARAALLALANVAEQDGLIYDHGGLREIAAEPKPPTAVDIIQREVEDCREAYSGTIAVNVADRLRAAGLLAESEDR